MMHFLRKIAISMFLGLASFAYLTPRAEAVQHEISLGVGTLNFTNAISSSQFSFGYEFRLQEWIGIGAHFDYTALTFQDTRATTWTLILGGTANLGPGIDNFFATLGLVIRAGSGTTDVTTTTDPTGLGLAVLVGKRFTLVGTLLYKPMLGFIAAGAAGFVMYPVHFCLVF